jgi:hypothetical protein
VSFVPQFAQLAMRRRAHLEGTKRFGGATPQRADELAVVLVRNLARAVVELELLERRKRAIALLGQRKPPLFELVGPGEHVVLGPGLTQKGQGDQPDASDGEDGTDEERSGQARTVAPA